MCWQQLKQNKTKKQGLLQRRRKSKSRTTGHPKNKPSLRSSITLPFYTFSYKRLFFWRISILPLAIFFLAKTKTIWCQTLKTTHSFPYHVRDCFTNFIKLSPITNNIVQLSIHNNLFIMQQGQPKPLYKQRIQDDIHKSTEVK